MQCGDIDGDIDRGIVRPRVGVSGVDRAGMKTAGRESEQKPPNANIVTAWAYPDSMRGIARSRGAAARERGFEIRRERAVDRELAAVGVRRP